MKLYQVNVPHFCAGIEVDEKGYVRRTAPILAWAKGKHLTHVRRWAEAKCGSVREVES